LSSVNSSVVSTSCGVTAANMTMADAHIMVRVR
jgi:hypothetical protein